MNHQNHSKITVREAITEQDTTLFLQQLHAYFKRDICPDPKDEDLAYFLGDEYRTTLRSLHERKEDRLYYLFFTQNEQDIGFAMPVIYESEDGKCFILEFCVYPRFRGNGTGTACAAALFDWAVARGAQYFALNSATDRRTRFWKRCGFSESSVDESGETLMRLLPEKAPSGAEN